MKFRTLLPAAVLGVSMISWSPAQEVTPSEIPPAPGETHATAPAEHAPSYPHPSLPAEGNLWTGSMLIIIVGMFLMAAAVGMLSHAEQVEEAPVDDHGHGHGHDDAHGSHGAHDSHGAHGADHGHAPH